MEKRESSGTFVVGKFSSMNHFFFTRLLTFIGLVCFITNVSIFGQTISEVDADQSGTDAAEFVELSGPPNGSLDGYVLALVNGSNSDVYECHDLDGHTFDANGIFVIGNVDENDYTGPGVNATNWLQNGADGVALVQTADCPLTCPITPGDIVSALGYDTNDSNNGNIATCLNIIASDQINEDDNNDSENESIQWDGTSWVVTETTPGVVNAGSGGGGTLTECFSDNGDFGYVVVTNDAPVEAGNLGEWNPAFSNYQINGYCGNGCVEDFETWIISPLFDYSAATQLELNFSLEHNFGNTDLVVAYSNDYTGCGNPNLSSWTTLSTIAAGTTGAQNLDIFVGGIGGPFYLGYQYLPGTFGYSEWRLSGISIDADDCTNNAECAFGCVHIENAGCVGADYVFDVVFTASNTSGFFEVIDEANGNATLATGTSSPITVTLPGNTSTTALSVNVIDDLDESQLCKAIAVSVTPEDCSAPTDPECEKLYIAGILDATLPGGIPKVFQLCANGDIADLSIYGLGVANNGGGSDGVEYTSLVGDLLDGECIWIISNNDADAYADWFGTTCLFDYENDIANVNGDDAVELFCDLNMDGTIAGTELVDLFGDVVPDGTGECWEYLDGWAVNDLGMQNNGVFDCADWTFSGTNVLDGALTNATSDMPYPNTPDCPCVVENFAIANTVCLGTGLYYEVSFDHGGDSGLFYVLDDDDIVIATGSESPIIVETAFATGTTPFDVSVVDASDFTCTDIPVTVTPPADCATVSNGEAAEIADPCVCLGANSPSGNNDQFYEVIMIIAGAGETWTVLTNTGLNSYPGDIAFVNGDPLVAGTADGLDNDLDGVIDEVDEEIYYTLQGLHVDGVGYDMIVTNGILGLQIGNLCDYGTGCPSELEVVANAACEAQDGTLAAQNEYYIEVIAIGGAAPGEDVTVTVDGVDQLFTTGITFGPFAHSGVDVGGTLMPLDAADALGNLGSTMVAETICGYPNAEWCDNTSTNANPGFILNQSIPGSFVTGITIIQSYILVDDAGAILEVNQTGFFQNLSEADYEVYSINYDTAESAIIDPLIEVGDPIVDILANTTACLANCGPYDFTVDCPAISITDPCSCLDNATILDITNATGGNDGQFSDVITIMQEPFDAAAEWWLMTNTGYYQFPGVSDLLNPTTSVVPAGPYTGGGFTTPAVMPTGIYTDGSAGIKMVNGLLDGIDNDGDGIIDNPEENVYYTLLGIHIDALGFDVVFTNGADILQDANSCYYPDLEIPLPVALCNLIDEFDVLPFVAAFDGLTGDAITGIGNIYLDGDYSTPITTLDPTILALGDHTLNYVFDQDPTPNVLCEDCSPGCEAEAQLTFEVTEMCDDIPTANEWGLLSLALVLMSMVLIFVRQREEEPVLS